VSDVQEADDGSYRPKSLALPPMRPYTYVPSFVRLPPAPTSAGTVASASHVNPALAVTPLASPTVTLFTCGSPAAGSTCRRTRTSSEGPKIPG
jgi:hypothetical protein